MPDLEPRTIRMDTDDLERVEQYMDRENCTEAEAFRRLLRTGLDVEERPGPYQKRASYAKLLAADYLKYTLVIALATVAATLAGLPSALTTAGLVLSLFTTSAALASAAIWTHAAKKAGTDAEYLIPEGLQ